jgi:hypothetical protein
MINYFFVIYLYQYDSVNKHGQMGGLWFISVNLFTTILIVVTVNLFIFTRYHTWINFAIILIFTVIAYIIFIIVAHRATLFKSVGTMVVTFGSPRFWMSIIFICGTCALIDYLILGFDFIFRITLAKILQILYNQRGELNDEYNLPKCIGDRINRYKTFEQQKVHNENEVYKIPQNTAYFPEDTKSEGNVGINNINVNRQPEDGYVGIKDITVSRQPDDGYNRINQITVNNRQNNKVNRNSFDNMTDDSNQFFNNNNSNLNIDTNLQLFNNQVDDMDIFPNYQRPSLGNNNNFN